MLGRVERRRGGSLFSSMVGLGNEGSKVSPIGFVSPMFACAAFRVWVRWQRVVRDSDAMEEGSL